MTSIAVCLESIEVNRRQDLTWHTACSGSPHNALHSSSYSTITNVFTVQRTNTYIHTYIQTDSARVHHVNAGLAQARPNKNEWNNILRHTSSLLMGVLKWFRRSRTDILAKQIEELKQKLRKRSDFPKAKAAITVDDLYEDETRRTQTEETRLPLPNTSTRMPKTEKTEKTHAHR